MIVSMTSMRAEATNLRSNVWTGLNTAYWRFVTL